MAVGRSTQPPPTNTRGGAWVVTRGAPRVSAKEAGYMGRKRGGNWAHWLKPKPEKEVNGFGRETNDRSRKRTNKLPR